MNNCCFTGFLVENPHAEVVNDVVRTEFWMVCYQYRKSKATGEKTRIPTYIRCEAWHTGAETIEKFATKGTKITVSASAKNLNPETDEIIFRINEFDICQKERIEDWT